MQKRNGYVCAAQTKNPLQVVLFGPNVNLGGRLPYENIRTNGLTFFEEHSQTLRALRVVRRLPELAKAKILSLKLEWAEAPEECRAFSDADSLFVLAWSEVGGQKEYFLAGPAIPGGGRFASDFSLVTSNGFVRFGCYRDAEWACSEIARQGQMPATIGRITLSAR